MAVYAITGKLGSGKGKAGIQRLREYMRQGKRVATNCDVFLEHLDHDKSRSVVIRVPDKPTSTDLYLIGSGNKFIEFEPNITHGKLGLIGSAPLVSPRMLPGFDESFNGALVLDECGSWLNTRDFQNKGRAELLEWCIHARKYGWDIFFIMQNITQIDKQIRESLFEYVVRLNRLDRMKVPIISSMVNFVSAGALSGALPRLHVAVVRLGASSDGLVADRWVFRGDDLHQAYNTTQVFTENYPHGTQSLLSPWHLSSLSGLPKNFIGPVRPGNTDFQMIRPRSQPSKPLHKHMTKFLLLSLLIGATLGVFGIKYFGNRLPSELTSNLISPSIVNESKISDSITGQGFYKDGANIYVILSDKRIIQNPINFKSDDKGWEAQITPELRVKGSPQ